MFSHKDQLKHALNITMYVSLYSLACLLILFLGSWVGLAVPYQIVLIALILLTWPFAIAVNRYRKKKEQRQSGDDPQPLARKGPRQKADSAGLDAPARDYDELTRGAEEAVEWLRGTKLAAAKSIDPIYK